LRSWPLPEAEWTGPDMHTEANDTLPLVGVVGAGRLGSALVAALREAGKPVIGPARRGEVPAGCGALLLCVPDAEIPAAAQAVAGAAPLVGHTSGATPLSALDPAARAGAAVFGWHPLQTFSGAPIAERPAGDALAAFAGAGCAVAGSSPEALSFAATLARRLRMTPFEIDDAGRAAYHAAASIASNFLVTLQAAAEQVAIGAGLAPADARALLAPLVRRTVENHVALGAERALTGPVARGDEETVAAQREAVEQAAPELLALFDELVRHTRRIAGPRGARVRAAVTTGRGGRA
jgi:predicted short-subunit dehydrogenase-like oxidoreductase (DUF2520 family)